MTATTTAPAPAGPSRTERAWGRFETVYERPVGRLVDIAVGALHRPANRAAQDMEIVELPFGERLDAGDVERLRDEFGRV